MQTLPLPECVGTVLVHRNDLVTCTRSSCPRDVPLETWFSFHTSFAACGIDDCPYCRFGAPVQLGNDHVGPTSNGDRGTNRQGRLLEPAFRRHV